MRSEGFPFIVWGLGAGPCSLRLPRRVAGVSRARRVDPGCVVNSVPLGSALRARRACAVCGAVPWGLLLGRSCGCRSAVGICVSGASRVWRGWRCVMGIAAGRVAWVPLCHADCCWAGRVGGAVPCGLLLGGSRGWRCAMGIAAGRVAWVPLCHGDCCSAGRVGGCAMRIAAQRVVWVPLCHGDCCWAGRVGTAVPWGLLLGGSRVRRCVMGFAGGRVAWVAPCLKDC